MPKIQFSVNRDITDEFLDEILRMVPSSIGYWADIMSSHYAEDPNLSKIMLVLPGEGEKGEDVPHEITIATIKDGVEKLLALDTKDQPLGSTLGVPHDSQCKEWLLQSVIDGDTSMVDSDVADLICQMAIHGEPTYS
jgi:hypothetical protein